MDTILLNTILWWPLTWTLSPCTLSFCGHMYRQFRTLCLCTLSAGAISYCGHFCGHGPTYILVMLQSNWCSGWTTPRAGSRCFCRQVTYFKPSCQNVSLQLVDQNHKAYDQFLNRKHGRQISRLNINGCVHVIQQIHRIGHHKRFLFCHRRLDPHRQRYTICK